MRKSQPIHVNFTMQLRLGSVIVDASVSLGSPPPPCSNPDSPAFSDSGDPDEVEIDKVILEADDTETPITDQLTDVDRDDIDARAVQVAMDHAAWHGYDYRLDPREDD